MTRSNKKNKITEVIKNPELAETRLLHIFREDPFRPFNLKQAAAQAGLQGKEFREAVHEALSSLVEKGILHHHSNGKYQLKLGEQDYLTGEVDMTSSGILYVKVDGLDHDVMVDSSRAGHALHGDIVKVLPVRRRRNGSIEGEVTEVVRRSDRKYVGRIELSKNFAFVQLDSRKMPNDIFVPIRDIKGAQDGDKVLVRVTEWPSTSKNPLGEIIDVLGTAGDNDTEMHAILAEFDLPYHYPREVVEAAENIPDPITPKEIGERRDFRDTVTFTIDPKDAKDFDDALSLREIRKGVWEVGVHIADVTHYVKPDTLLETEAMERATSVYLVDRTIPMLPERLSNELCSLRPNEDKLCFSAVFELNEDAEVLNEWFGRTVIHSDRRFTYEEAQQIIETGKGDFHEEVLRLNSLARTLRKERFKNGSIGFERAEAKFDLDDKGKPLGVYFKEAKDSNHLVEEFMLLANRKVAEFIGRKRRGKSAERTFIYRVHDMPTPEKLADFKSFVVRFGYYMKGEKGRAVAKEMNKLLKNIKGTKEENLISTLAIRSMAKAVYTTENIGHYGLAFDYYTHFTSPIRRYPDMMVHRLLAHYLAGGKSADKAYYEQQCEHSTAMEIRASDAERASIKYKMVEFMEDKIGNEFDGTISGVTDWGIYVELNENKIEGMVSLRDMTDDYYLFDEMNYSVTGRSNGLSFTLGDEVRIRVKKADLQRKQLDFEMVSHYDFDTGKQVRLLKETGNDSPRRSRNFQGNGNGRNSKNARPSRR